MINGAHAIIYSSDAEKVRAFMRDVLGWKSVDAGRGWLNLRFTADGGNGSSQGTFLLVTSRA